MSQPDLFGHVPESRRASRPAARAAGCAGATWPDGLRYGPDFLDSETEAALIAQLRAQPFEAADYYQYTARRRIVAFGGRYDFSASTLREGPPIPDWLQPLKVRAAEWAGLDPQAVTQALLSEFAPGTPLGWHRDVPDFEAIIGVSLGAECTLRFRRFPPRREDGRAARAEFRLQPAPRSIYTLLGEARWGWQHAVSPTKALRWSITFRTTRRHTPDASLGDRSARRSFRAAPACPRRP